jgi:dTDP-4-dehydrorhamnose reductase
MQVEIKLIKTFRFFSNHKAHCDLVLGGKVANVIDESEADIIIKTFDLKKTDVITKRKDNFFKVIYS